MKITKNHKVLLLAVCPSDYFGGYHLPCIAVAIYRTMTFKDIADSFEEEFNACYDYINPNDDKDIERLYDDYINELKSIGDEIFCETEDISEIDDIDPQYAYFSIVNIKCLNGLKFLNP